MSGRRTLTFGAPVRRLVSEIELERRGLVKTKLKVHVLEPIETDRGPHVAIEVIQSTFGSWQMSAIVLSRTEAKKLGDELVQAAREAQAGSLEGKSSMRD